MDLLKRLTDWNRVPNNSRLMSVGSGEHLRPDAIMVRSGTRLVRALFARLTPVTGSDIIVDKN